MNHVGDPIIRAATPADGNALRELGLREGLDDAHVMLARDDTLIAAGGFDPEGTPAEPDHPCLIVAHGADAMAHDRLALIEAMISIARERGVLRLTTIVDPLNYTETVMYEKAGFQPTGRGPYMTIGAGHIQYVTGYQDASGSNLDLAINLE